MITPDDIIILPYTPDLTQGGIAYACRSLPHTFNRMGGSPFDRLRRIVAGVTVELALRRHLAEWEVPFDVLGATPFTEPDRYDLSLGGRRCDLKSYLVFNKDRIRQARLDPGHLLAAPALVPADQLGSDHLRDEDLYLFAFLHALVTPRRQDLQKALVAGQPTHLLYPMPDRWSRPVDWSSLGRLALKSDSPAPLELTLEGQRIDRAYCSEQVQLAPRRRVQVREPFFSLTSLHVTQTPEGVVGVHSARLSETHLVEPAQWGNIWVYGLEILLVGYLPCGEFRRRARRLPAGSRVLQYPRTRTENLALPMGELRPLSDLFVQVKNWAGKRGSR